MGSRFLRWRVSHRKTHKVHREAIMSETLENGQIVLTYTEAIERLPEKEEIHTFIQAGNMLIGADWDRETVLAELKLASMRDDKHMQIQESGDSAQGMGHGICIIDPLRGPVFIEARGPE